MNLRRSTTVLLLVGSAIVWTAACGKKGAPLPPRPRVPSAVGDLAVERFDRDVIVRFTVPTTNIDGFTPGDVGRVEVYAITANRPPVEADDPEDVRRLSTLVASEPVRRVIPPPPPAKPGEPPPPMPAIPPGPGVDQGATVVVRETLPENAAVPVELPAPKRVPTPPQETTIEPLPGPLVAPTSESGPVRYYYAVAVSPSGRYGPGGRFTPIPLGTTSSAPGAPTITYDETTMKIAWGRPPDARGIEDAPESADVLPSRPIVEGPPRTMYDVYEVPAKPPANATPEMPIPLTPAPIAAEELTQPIVEFGAQRCFAVRPVDIVGGIHVRGPSSPVICVDLKDTFAPAAPKSLAAVATAGLISLIWEPNSEGDLAGYLVLRGDAPDATLTPLTPEPVREPSFRDSTVREGVRYVYAVIAVDRAGNRSPESERVEETARQ